MDGWWWRHPRHARYLLREGTSLFVGAYAAVLLWGLFALAGGPEAWSGWLAAMRHPLAVLFHLLVLGAVLWHAVTWFAVAPKTIPPLAVAGRPIGTRTLVGLQYLGAAVVSAAILIAAAAGGP